MSLMPPFPLTIAENEDFSITWTYYPVANGSPADWTGYTCLMMVRLLIGDAAPLVTYTPTLGGTAGTITLTLTAAQSNTLAGLLSYGSGIYDILLTSSGGVKTHLVPPSTISIQRSVTR